MPRPSKSTKPGRGNDQQNHERPIHHADDQSPGPAFTPSPNHDVEAAFGSSLLTDAEELFTETQVRAVSSPMEYALGRDEIVLTLGSHATRPAQDPRARGLTVQVFGRGPRRHGETRFDFDAIDAHDVIRLHTALGRLIRDAQKVGLLPSAEG